MPKQYRFLAGDELIEFELDDETAAVIHRNARAQGMGDCEFVMKIALDHAEELLGVQE